MEKAFWHLEAPILRVTGYDIRSTSNTSTSRCSLTTDALRNWDSHEEHRISHVTVETTPGQFEFRLPDIGEGVVEGEVVKPAGERGRRRSPKTSPSSRS